jgi:hypothetical protein
MRNTLARTGIPMDRSDFDLTQRLLMDRGLVIEEATYKCEVFGSWWVTVRSNPPFRILWDGRDGWLYVQRRSEHQDNPWGLTDWDDMWIEREQDGQTPQAAIERLEDFRNR